MSCYTTRRNSTLVCMPMSSLEASRVCMTEACGTWFARRRNIFLHGVCWLRRFGRHRSQCPHGTGAFRGFPQPFRDASPDPPQKRHRTPASGGGGGISGPSLSISIPGPVTKPATPSCITRGRERASSRFPGNPLKCMSRQARGRYKIERPHLISIELYYNSAMRLDPYQLHQ